MTYVLDTSILSALMRAEPGPSERLVRLAPGDVAIPQPVLAEIRYGLARLPPSRRREALEGRLDLLLRTIARAPWDDEVSRCFGELKASLEKRGERVDDFDVAIAAHGLRLGSTVVTRNTRHFTRIREIEVEDWPA